MEQLAALRPLVGTTVSAAVIPAGAGTSWAHASREFREALHPLERLLHGWRHRRPRSASLISWASGRCDEFAGLKPFEIARTLCAGQRVLAETFGRAADGFLPPAWRTGALGAADLASASLAFQVGFVVVRRVGGRRIPLATYSWDWGPIAAAGRLGAVLGGLGVMRPASVRVMALHPADGLRGYLPAAMDRIRRCLDDGLAPTRFSDLLEATA